MTNVMSWDQEIDEWLSRSGVNPSRLSLLATANPRAVQRIKDGTAQVSTLRAVLEYVRNNPQRRMAREQRRDSGA